MVKSSSETCDAWHFPARDPRLWQQEVWQEAGQPLRREHPLILLVHWVKIKVQMPQKEMCQQQKVSCKNGQSSLDILETCMKVSCIQGTWGLWDVLSLGKLNETWIKKAVKALMQLRWTWQVHFERQKFSFMSAIVYFKNHILWNKFAKQNSWCFISHLCIFLCSF